MAPNALLLVNIVIQIDIEPIVVLCLCKCLPLNRLCEKFRVHSQPEKAEALEQLTEQFLSSRLERNYPRSDAHYGVLLLLFCLSNSPLHADFLPTPNTPPAPGN